MTTTQQEGSRTKALVIRSLISGAHDSAFHYRFNPARSPGTEKVKDAAHVFPQGRACAPSALAGGIGQRNILARRARTKKEEGGIGISGYNPIDPLTSK